MANKTTLFKCCRCGYSFEPQNDLRCPRCFNPLLSIGACSGSCSSCTTRQESTKLNLPTHDKKSVKNSDKK
ncbi:MAG: hypothetical protein WCY82_07260 [Desulfotomaculaceae bacterium]